MTRYGNYIDSSNRLVELTKELKEHNTMPPEPKVKVMTIEEQDIAKKLLQWQAQYQKDNPKASLRNVKRAAKNHFKIK